MSATLTVRDETATGRSVGETVIDFLTEHITVRELIRSRVYQEVQDYNLKQPEHFRGLIQPTDAEATLNGYKLKEQRQIDWKPQFEKACEAFQHNRILILIDDHQAADLDEQITLRTNTEITFLKLVPLVGG